MSTVVGFDFGTTNSVMSIVVGGRSIPILEDGMPHPSVVCYQGSQITVGRKAKQRLTSADKGVIGNIVKSPKTLLGRQSVEVDGHTYSPKEVVRDIVRYVRMHANESKTTSNESFERAVVTIPIDMNGERRRELREACRMAGLAVVQFVHEPLAALYGHLRTQPDFENELRRLNRQLILVFDWGGGTLDLTLCRIEDGMLVQIKNAGCSEVGGDVIDDMLVNEIERLELASRNIAHEVGVQVGAKSRLRAAAEAAKVQLSSKDSHSLLLTDYFSSDAGNTDIMLRLNRGDVEACISSKIDQGMRRIDALLASANVDPASIRLCLATGGMVNMPLIQSRLLELFGSGRVQVSTRGSTIISEGAAWIAHDKARLSLAKNIEMLVARQAYFPLLKAGSLMPREGEVHAPGQISMYCVDPTDGVAKLQVCSPIRTGRNVQVTDDREILGVLSIQVANELPPLHERLYVKVSVDEDLVLEVQAVSTIANSVDTTEIFNLEFGLEVLPRDAHSTYSQDDEAFPALESGKNSRGAVLLRANISERNDDLSLIPGEVLAPYAREHYGFASGYFDPARTPPKISNFEKCMYQPCAICQKIRCECASIRAGRKSEAASLSAA